MISKLKNEVDHFLKENPEIPPEKVSLFVKPK